MEIDNNLNLKDYRIIKTIIYNKQPLECIEEIGLSKDEIEYRLVKIKKLLNNYLKTD